MGIQGLGGTGKSALAIYFYENSNFSAKFWADVSLKPDFTVFAEKIIISLGGRVSFPLDITELINNLLHLLSQRRCLLVVDNLETLLDAERNWQDEYYQQFFSRWKDQGTCSTLLITTQDKPQLFQGGEHWYTLGGMKIEEGITLLNKLAIQGTEAELKAFVDYVDGHPLTINLVAGYLREYCDRQLSKAREEFNLEQFELAYQEPSGFYRNQAQNALLSWIIQQHLSRLNNQQTNFLINLSVYRLPFNREAASYMLLDQEVKPIVIQKKLQELSNHSLLIKTEDNNFQFESLVQKFIFQEANNLTTAHVQAIKYYQANLKEVESWQVLEDVSEYLEIIYHCCELKHYAVAKDVLNICVNFLNLRGYYAVLVEVYEQLTQGWQFKLQPETRSDYAWALNTLGLFYVCLGKIKQSIAYHNKSLVIFREIRDQNGKASSLNNLGISYINLGEYRKAIDFHQKSLSIAQQIGNLNEQIKSLNNLGLSYINLGEYRKAIDFHQKSLSIARQIGNLDEENKSLNNLGNVCFLLGKCQQGLNLFRQSLRIKQQIGDLKGESTSLVNIGNSYLHLGKIKRSIDCYLKSLNITRQIGDRNGEAACLTNLGNAYNSLGEYPRAIDYLQKSLVIQQQIGDHNGEAKSLGNLGNAYNSLREYPRAIDYHQKSLAIKQQIGDKRGEAISWFSLGETQKNLHQKPEAKVAYENARKLYQKMRLDEYVENCDQAIQDINSD